MTLAEAKKIQIDAIDENTEYLIKLNGFTFPPSSGNTFSFSIEAQINWSNILQISEINFPQPLKTREETLYMLQLSDRQSFYDTAVAAKKTYLDSGGMLCYQIEAMTNIDEVLNFSDPRII